MVEGEQRLMIVVQSYEVGLMLLGSFLIQVSLSLRLRFLHLTSLRESEL
jgi:hypothetical protein